MTAEVSLPGAVKHLPGDEMTALDDASRFDKVKGNGEVRSLTKLTQLVQPTHMALIFVKAWYWLSRLSEPQYPYPYPSSSSHRKAALDSARRFCAVNKR